MDLRQNLGTTVRQLRVELGLSQVQLAERMGGDTQQSDISRIERGLLAWPRPQLLQSLAAALELSTLELITQSGWMTPEEFERYHEAPVVRSANPLVILGQRNFGDEEPIRDAISPDKFRLLTTLDGTTLLDMVRSTTPAVVIVQQGLPELELDQLESIIWEHRLDTTVIVIGTRKAIPSTFHFVEAPATSAVIEAILVAIGVDEPV